MLAVLACLCSPVCVGTAAERPTGQRWAVLVGIDDYVLAEKLQYCGSDQRALRERLVAAGFPEQQVFLLDDRATENRFRPLRANIERQIDALLKLAEQDDLVVIGYSGHGVQIDGNTFLVPADGDPEDPATLVPLDGIYAQLQACMAATKLVIVDACRNDPVRAGRRSALTAAGARGLGQGLKEARLPQGTVLFNSCAPGEISWEEEKFKHGVFMHYVLEGLAGRADDDADGRLSLNELAKYATRATKTYVLNEKSVTQRPYLRNEGEADLLDHPLLPVPKVTAPKPGSVTTNSIGMKLVAIPAGEFEMGGRETNGQLETAGFRLPDGFDAKDERPVHRVRITKPFSMGVHEVTLGQFMHFYHDGYKGRLDCETDGKGGGGYNPANIGHQFDPEPRYRPWSWGHPNQTNDHPVVNVSWNDAVAFCNWLSRKEGKRYRLPTEAEWEYACRAGTTTRYWTGDDPESLAASENIADGTAQGKFPWWDFTIRSRDGYAFTSPVGSFDRPNRFGLHDMHGNACEWCSDWYDQAYYRTSPAADPKGPSSAGSFRVVRGGSWDLYPVICRSANRLNASPARRYYDLGFRVVLSVE